MNELHEFVTASVINWVVYTILVSGICLYAGMYFGAFLVGWGKKGTPPHTRKSDYNDEHQADDMYVSLVRNTRQEGNE